MRRTLQGLTFLAVSLIFGFQAASAQCTTITTSDNLCPGSMVTFTGGCTGTVTDWSWDDGTDSGTSTDEMLTVMLGIADITISVGDAGDGSTSYTETFSLLGSPSATFTANTNAACLNDAQPVLTFTGSGGSNPYLFTYNINGGADMVLDSDPGNNSTEDLDVPTTTAGSFIYTLTSVSDQNGCSTEITTQTETITINPLPDVTVPSMDTVVNYCAGSTVPTISFNLTGESPYSVTYTIDGSPTTVNNVTSPFTIGSPVPGVYIITNVTDSNSCSTGGGFASNSITVVENPAPAVTDPSTDETENYCQGATAPTIEFILSGTGPYSITYTLDGSPTTVTNASSPFAIGSAVPGVYQITSITDANGCSTTGGYMSNTITVVEDPTPDVTAPVVDEVVNYCAGSAAPTISFDLGGTGPFDVTYTVNGTNPTTVNGTTTPFTISSASPGIYIITSVTDATTCSTVGGYMSNSITVVENSTPEVTDPTTDETVNYCVGSAAPTISFDISGTGPFDLTYTIDGMNPTTVNNTTSPFTIGSAAPGEYQITSISDDSNNCATAPGYESSTITVVENSIPVVTMPATDIDVNYCQGDAVPNIQFDFTGNGPFSVTYTIDGGTPITSTNINSPLIITSPSPGEYVITDITDMNACSTAPGFESSSITVIEDPAPTPTIVISPNQSSFCEGSVFALSVSGLVGNPNDYTYAWDLADGTTSASQVITVNNADLDDDGTYSLIVTDNGSMCTAEVSVDITINELPNVSLGAEGPFCLDDDPIDLSGSPAGGTFSGVGITDMTAGTFNPSIAGVGTHTITYTYEDGNLCEDSDMIDIVVYPIPTLTLDSVDCALDLQTYTVFFTSDGTVTSSVGTVVGSTVVGVPAGVDVTITATSVDNCTSIIDVSAPNCTCPTIPPPVSGGDEEICFGDTNPMLSVTAGPGLSANWYLEAQSGGTILLDGDGTLTYEPEVTAAAVYTYWVETFDPISDCVSTTRTPVQFTIFALPTVSISAAGPYCIDGAAENLVGSPTGGTFSGPGITNSVMGTFNPATAGVGTHTITYTFTDLNTCVNSTTIDIIVNALPTVGLAAAGPFCVDAGPTDLVGSPAGGTFAGDGIVNGNNGTFDPASAGVGTHTITYTFQDGNGCVNTDMTDVVVKPLPTLTILDKECSADLETYSITFNSNGTVSSSHGDVNNITGIVSNIPVEILLVTLTSVLDDCVTIEEVIAPNCECPPLDPPTSNGDAAICFGDENPTLSVTTSGSNISANWYDNSGTLLTGEGGALTYTPIVTSPDIYTYSVEALDTDSDCVSQGVELVTFTIYALPVPNITPDNPVICENTTVVLDAGDYEEWLWNDNSTDQTLEVSLPGNYTVIVTDENECTGVDQVTVGLNPLPFVSLPNADLVVEYCENETAPNIEFVLSGTGPFNVQYTIDGVPAPEETGIVDKLVITEPGPGEYQVVSISDNLCSTSSGYESSIIEVKENPEPSFNIIKTPVNNDIVCEGADFELSTDLVGGGFTYSWSTPLGNFATETIEFDDVTTAASGIYSLTVSDNTATQCMSVETFEVNVSVVAGSIETNTDQTQICLGESIILIAENVPGEDGVTWLNGVPAGEENEVTVEVSPTVTTTYDAILRNSDGCERSESITITVTALPTPAISSDVASYCNGSEVTLETLADYDNYNWSTGQEDSEITFNANSNETTYEVTVTDENGCTGIDDIMLDIKLNPSVGISTDVVNLPAGTTADFQAKDAETDLDCGIQDYEWYVNGTIQQGGPSADFSYTFNVEGEIDVCVVLVDDCGCRSQEICQTMVIFENGQCSVGFTKLGNICLDEESGISAIPMPGTVDGANLPTEGWFVLEGEVLDETFKATMLNVEIGEPGRRFIVRHIGFLDKPFAKQDKFLDTITVEFKNPVDYEYEFYYDFGNCEKTSSPRIASVQQTPSFSEIIIDEQACFGESPRIEFVLPDDVQDFRLTYSVNGGSDVNKDFNGGADFIQFTNPTTDLEINFNQLTNFNPGEVLVATGCTSDDIDPSNFVIEVLPELTYTVEDQCNDELTMIQYTITLDGGTGDFSLNGQNVVGNEFETPFFESGQSQSYTLIDEGCDEDNSELITLSNSCETCVLFEPLVAEQEIIVDGDQNVCESDLATFSLSKAPDILDNQIVVYAILSSPSNLYDEDLVIIDSLTADPTVFEFDINSSPELVVGTEYYITAFIFTKQATGFKVDGACAGLNPKSLIFYGNPDASIENLEDDLDICKNEIDFQLGIDNNVTSSTLTANSPNVNIVYIEGDTRALINIGDVTETELIITLNQSNSYSTSTGTLTCSDQSDITLNVLDRFAPPKDTIIQWPDFMYAYTVEGLCYQWGLNDAEIEGETTRFLIRDEALAEGDVLWINAWDCDDTLLECVTTIYFNATGPPGFQVEPSTTIDYNLYPNPTGGIFTLELDGFPTGNFNANVISSTGQLLNSVSFTKESILHNQEINVEELVNGLYILQVVGENDESQFIKFIKN